MTVAVTEMVREQATGRLARFIARRQEGRGSKEKEEARIVGGEQT